MKKIDEQYTTTPFYGNRRMVELLRQQGIAIGRKRMRTLMRIMGLQAIYPRPRLSKGGPECVRYPYLLRELPVVRPDQVWCSDITYIRLRKGFAYLVAILDWYSRYVVAWELSISLEPDFCVSALERALRLGKPEIFNSDQGGQFTSNAFTGCLKAAGVQISMDGRGRVFDNIFIERLWRTVKYEAVYLNDWETVAEARSGLKRYFHFYNNERLHQTFDYQTPRDMYAATGTGG